MNISQVNVLRAAMAAEEKQRAERVAIITSATQTLRIRLDPRRTGKFRVLPLSWCFGMSRGQNVGR